MEFEEGGGRPSWKIGGRGLAFDTSPSSRRLMLWPAGYGCPRRLERLSAALTMVVEIELAFLSVRSREGDDRESPSTHGVRRSGDVVVGECHAKGGAGGVRGSVSDLGPLNRGQF
jgi:hypothetical protein